MNGKRLIEVMAESDNINDKFLCIEGNWLGDLLHWDSNSKGTLKDRNGNSIDIYFSTPTDNPVNKWIIVKGDKQVD
jgi:hypothetical protein